MITKEEKGEVSADKGLWAIISESQQEIYKVIYVEIDLWGNTLTMEDGKDKLKVKRSAKID